MRSRFIPRIGSLALRLCRVAEGSLDAAFAGGQSRDWDLAAANLIVQEANGRMTALSGDAIQYNRREVTHGVLVAAGRDRHARIVEHFRIVRCPEGRLPRSSRQPEMLLAACRAPR